MTNGIDTLAAAFVMLLVVIDPLGLAPMFSALTRGRAAEEQRRAAVKAVFIAAVILALFAFTGSLILDYLGIGMPAFRIAGGALLFLIAIDMLLVRHSALTGPTAQERNEAVRRNDVAVFPLAIPLIAGPGALTTIMLLTRERPLDEVLAVLGLMLAVLAITLAMFLAARPVERLLGETGINVITRLLGILLAALAVQFVLDGLIESLPGLAGAELCRGLALAA